MIPESRYKSTPSCNVILLSASIPPSRVCQAHLFTVPLKSFNWELLREHIGDLIDSRDFHDSQSIPGYHVIPNEHISYLDVLGFVVELRIRCKLRSSLIIAM